MLIQLLVLFLQMCKNKNAEEAFLTKWKAPGLYDGAGFKRQNTNKLCYT